MEENNLKQESAAINENAELEAIFKKYANDYDIDKEQINEKQKNIDIERYAYFQLHKKGLENTNIERLLDITIGESKKQYEIKQSIETRVGLLLALWGVLISALIQKNIPASNVYIISAPMVHMAYKVFVVIVLVGQVLFGLFSLFFTYKTLKSYGYHTLSLKDKEQNFKGAVDDKYISLIQLLDSYTYCYINNSGAIAKKNEYYKNLIVSISLFAIFVILGYICTI